MSDLLHNSDFKGVTGATRATWLCVPCAYGVNAAAAYLYAHDKNISARAVAMGEYFLKPLDSVIQLLVAPVFAIINYTVNMSEAHKETTGKSWVLLLVSSPVTFIFTVLYRTCEIWCKTFCDSVSNILYPRKIIDAMRDQRLSMYNSNSSELVRKRRCEIFFLARAIVRDPLCDEINSAGLFLKTKVAIIKQQEVADEMQRNAKKMSKWQQGHSFAASLRAALE